jgi:hypothetical protein
MPPYRQNKKYYQILIYFYTYLLNILSLNKLSSFVYIYTVFFFKYKPNEKEKIIPIKKKFRLQ